MAWELFNEVQFTDAARDNKESVAAWHREMAVFLRAQDPYHHLVATSSDANAVPGLYDAMDFVQPHAYPPGGVAAVRSVDPAKWNKPVFFGEIGPGGELHGDDGTFLHNTLWASLLSRSSGAAQYWTWDLIDTKNLYSHFASATAFVQASGLASPDLHSQDGISVRTEEPGAVSFGPGGGWGQAKRTDFVFSPAGEVEGAGDMPAYLQGKANTALFPHAAFCVDLSRPGTFGVTIAQSARAGAHVVVLVDGMVAAERAFVSGERDTAQNVTLSASVPAGKHVVRLENRGADWARIGRIALSPFGPALSVMGKTGTQSALLWLRRANTAAAATPAAGVTGTVTIPGLRAGRYRIAWWDTRAGRVHSETTANVSANQALVVTTPAISDDLAAYIRRT